MSFWREVYSKPRLEEPQDCSVGPLPVSVRGPWYHLQNMQRAENRLEDKVECLSNDAMNVRPVKLTRRRKPALCAHIHSTTRRMNRGIDLCVPLAISVPAPPRISPSKWHVGPKIQKCTGGKWPEAPRAERRLGGITEYHP